MGHERVMTMVFPVRGAQVIMGILKRGPFAGSLMGPGGKVLPTETPLESAMREVPEEVGIRMIAPLDRIGTLAAYRADLGLSPALVHMYRGKWEGKPVETDEMVPFTLSFEEALRHPQLPLELQPFIEVLGSRLLKSIGVKVTSKGQYRKVVDMGLAMIERLAG